MNILETLAGLLETKQEEGGTTTGLYTTLFGTKDIPLAVSLDKDAKKTLFITAGILAAGAVITALLLKKL